MRFSFANRRRWALRVFVLAGSAVHVAGQYPGPAENRQAPWATPGVPPTNLGPGPDEIPLQRQPDFAVVLPTASVGPPSAQDSVKVSVVELQHPLSRKGRKLIERAQNDLNSGKTAEGIRRLQDALQEPSAAPWAHSILGATYLQLWRTADAITELEQAVQLLPIASNYSNLGHAHCIMGDTERGEEDLQHALQLDSSSPQTHYLIGLLLLDNKSRSHEACEQFQRAQTVQGAHVALAVCYVRSGQSEAAATQVRDFVGTGDDTRMRFWSRWVALIAAEARPSLAFGFYAQ
jgi:predicted Zn-dependent protease